MRNVEVMPLAEAQLMELEEALARWKRGCTFRVGDVVTPVALSSFGEHGRPYIVLEVIDPESRSTYYPDEAIGSGAFGFMPSMILYGYISPHQAGKVLVEHQDFIPWDKEIHDKK